ncbi:MAG: ParA family protein [Gammaproteobacteria bacterium]|nr:ParA family protein [Gammaproteobacteria bacterium]
MNVWAIANQKGGVGKTTTVVTLSGLLAAQGKRTLMVDLDPHGSLSAYFGHDPDTVSDSVYSLFQSISSKTDVHAEQVIRQTPYDNLSMMPASTALATLDRQLGTHEGMGLVLKKALQSVEHQYDHVLIDCPPVLGVLMVNALAACERLLIPVQTEFLAEKGLERMMHTLSMIQKASREDMPYLIVPTLFDKRTKAAKESLMVLRDSYNLNIWDSVIPVDTQIREASKKGIPLSHLNPKARGVIAYSALLTELLQRNTMASADVAEVGR